jgi:D-threonate/D-erythronate kinase
MTGQGRILIIADDLTGAMDSAGPFAGRGVETWVVADPAACDPSSLKSAQVVAVNTDSRHLSAPVAAERVADAVRRLAGSREVLFKKIDSTLRGNVVAETLAMLRESGRRAAWVAPAFPAQGRTVVEGIVRVNGVELGRTDFARDALSPPPLAPLHQVFASAAPGFDVRSVKARDCTAGERAIRVVDAVDNDDLALVAKNSAMEPGNVLLVGSAGLTHALAAQMFAGAPVPGARPGVEGPMLFVVGSRAMASAQQVEALGLEAGTVVLSLPNGMGENLAFPGTDNLVLRATAAAAPASAEEVAAHLAHHALSAVRAMGIKAVVATGGDTAMAILSASGNPALRVHGDLMPGIPYARILVDGTPIWLVTKAGGFGGQSALCDIARELRRTQ